MFYLRTGTPLDIRALLPGVVSMSILFGTTSLLAVTITFERRSSSFDRLLLAPLDLNLLMLAKTGGAILFGIVNAFVPILFVPISSLPIWLRPLSFVLPLTYGTDILHTSIDGRGIMPLWVSFSALLVFAAGLFAASLWNIRRKWVG